MDNSIRGRVVSSVVQRVGKQHHKKHYKEQGLLVKVEMPLFYSKQYPGGKKKASKTTSGSTQGGLNLNKEADGSGEEGKKKEQQQSYIDFKKQELDIQEKASREAAELKRQMLEIKHPSKVESVKNWKTPESSTEIRSFLGLEGYYQRFIENFSKIAKPLTLLTQKNKTYVWGNEQDEAFLILKEKLCNALVLALPDGPDDFVVYCDTSKQGEEDEKGKEEEGETKQQKLESEREARLDAARKQREEHWKELEAIRKFEEEYEEDPELEEEDEDNEYESFDYDDLHLAYSGE
ncbi:putative reverse transcriptase domain-containing protein [Tanacetum coccineum]